MYHKLLYAMVDYPKLQDQRECIDHFYGDFKKIFDSVPHQIFFVKLRAYELIGRVFELIKDFLSCGGS